MNNIREEYKSIQRQIRLDNKPEIWKDIPGYEGLYQASNLGRVKGLERYVYRNGFKTLKIKENILVLMKYGKYKNYYRIALRGHDNNKRLFLVHRLVSCCFLGLDLLDKSVLVCHKDDNPSNNILDNLFLGSFKDNMDDMNNKLRKYNKPVLQFSLDGILIKEWVGGKIACKILGFKSNHIGDCCLGKRKTFQGFIWKYI